MNDLSSEIINEKGKGILFARVASDLLKNGKIEQCLQVCEAGVKQFPNYAQGHFILAKCYQENDMVEEARTEYERVLNYDSAHLGALKGLAKLFHASGMDNLYKDYLYRLITQDPLNELMIKEAQEQGVYDQWRTDSSRPFSEVEKITADEIGNETESTEIEVKDTEDEKTEEKTPDENKMDLSQFENQDDDFNTIMDGLIQESIEDSEDKENINYIHDLQTPVEIESELMAEEKPILDYEQDELDDDEDLEFMEKESPFMEMDFSDDKKATEGQETESTIDDEESSAKPEKLKSEKLSEDHVPGSEEIEMAFKDETDEFDLKEKDEDETEKIEFDAGSEEEFNLDINSLPDSDKTEIMDEKLLSDTGDESTKSDQDEEIPDGENPYLKQKIISQTLGEILVSQKKYKEAKQVFEALKEQQPENQNINKKIEILDKIIELDKGDK